MKREWDRVEERRVEQRAVHRFKINIEHAVPERAMTVLAGCQLIESLLALYVSISPAIEGTCPGCFGGGESR